MKRTGNGKRTQVLRLRCASLRMTWFQGWEGENRERQMLKQEQRQSKFKSRSLRDDKQKEATEDARGAILQGVANLVARGPAFAFPGAWVDWVVLPLLAAAYEEHD